MKLEMSRVSIWWSAYLESIKLDVGIAMRKTSDNTLNGLLRTIWIVAYFVADLDNSAPILGGEVLVSGLGYAGVSRNIHISRYMQAITRLHAQPDIKKSA
jgi:hypothetical protein